ncbi:MAG TPA: 23S rRNA (uracil(1939)-C(5))-methyltransferase RlmD, partial [Polyangia bacterium]|nr:23S rRNA (uracil(1939)-C(5))-methyltransferase RlmD [Polyangia bacterium]
MSVSLRCIGVDDEGAGICTGAGESAVHVRGALPGEVVTAAVEHVSPHRPHAWGALEAIAWPSPERRAPVCPAFGPCGGCVLQHWDVAAQRAWKTERVRAALAAHPALAEVGVEPCVASPLDLGYRNNAKLVCARDAGGALILGAYAPRSHDVVELRGCRIVEAPLDAATVALAEALRAAGVEPYDERRLTGVLRYAVLRANFRGQVLATLVTARRAWAAGAAVAADLVARCPAVAGVVQNVNPTRGNVIFGEEEIALGGAPALLEEIGPARLRLSSRAFFQANRGVAALAYAHIARALGPVERAVDAYSGVGGIALTLATQARAVVGIESNAAAIADASAAAANAGITHVHFVVADAAEGLRALAPGAPGTADAVVLNPPRKGCAPAVLRE